MITKNAKPKGNKPSKKSAPAKPAAAAAPAKQATPAAPAKPAVKPAATAATRAKGRGVRYDAAQKKEVVDFVTGYNQKNGRGGQSAAARKFGITILTVSSWLKGSGIKSAKASKAGNSPKVAKVSSALTGKVKALLDLGDRIRKAEAELQKLQGQYSSLSASIRSVI